MAAIHSHIKRQLEYWEIGFAAAVLWRPTRWLALGLGLAIHLGIHVALVVGFFSAASVWGYLSFVPYDWVERLWDWRARRRSGPGDGRVEGEE